MRFKFVPKSMTLDDLERPICTCVEKIILRSPPQQKCRATAGRTRDAAVYFDTYRILQRHRAFYLPQQICNSHQLQMLIRLKKFATTHLLQ